MNGPLSTHYRETVYVNILATSLPGRSKNRWQHHVTIGVFYEALRQPIPVFDDDDLHIGCLVVDNGRNLGVRVSHFSHVDLSDHVRRAMITATYQMEN